MYYKRKKQVVKNNFVITPKQVLFDKRLTDLAIRVWELLESKPPDQCFFSAYHIGKQLGKERRTVGRALKILERYGYLFREKQQNGRMLYQPVLPPEPTEEPKKPLSMPMAQNVTQEEKPVSMPMAQNMPLEEKPTLQPQITEEPKKPLSMPMAQNGSEPKDATVYNNKNSILNNIEDNIEKKKLKESTEPYPYHMWEETKKSLMAKKGGLLKNIPSQDP